METATKGSITNTPTTTNSQSSGDVFERKNKKICLILKFQKYFLFFSLLAKKMTEYNFDWLLIHSVLFVFTSCYMLILSCCRNNNKLTKHVSNVLLRSQHQRCIKESYPQLEKVPCRCYWCLSRVTCLTCGELFPSRSKLFDHLNLLPYHEQAVCQEVVLVN